MEQNRCIVFLIHFHLFIRHMKRHITHILQLNFFLRCYLFIRQIFFFFVFFLRLLIFYSIETDAHISRL